jgi:hypothetical protein
MTLSVPCLFQTKALLLSDAIDALFLCVSHGVAPVERMDYTTDAEERVDFHR